MATDIELRIQAAIDGVNQLTGLRNEVGKLGLDSETATKAARELDGALDGLMSLQQLIGQFRDAQARINETAVALDKAREQQRALSGEVAASLGPTQQQFNAQSKANAEVVKLEASLEKAKNRQRDYAQQVIATDEPSARLVSRYERSTSVLGGLERKLFVAKQNQEAANKAVAEGSEPSDRLAKKHEQVTENVEQLNAQLQHEQQQLEGLAKKLNEAGVETGELDTASQRITQTFEEVAAKSRAFAEAQSKLSFVPHEQIEREARDLRGAYDTLKSSGKLTAQELAQANLKLHEGLLDLERSTNGWKDSLVKARVEIGAALAAFAPIGYTIKQAVDFETALAGVRKVVDGTDEQFEALTGRVRDLSKELPISADGLAEIAAAGGQLGVPIEKLDQFVELAAKMATAFNISAEEAGQAVAKLSNVFGLGLEGVEALGNGINVLGNTTAANEGQILEFLTRVGGSARTFGLTAEATAALGAAFIAMGKTPETAATAVNKLLTQLQTANVQSPKVQAALAGIGQSGDMLAAQIRENPQAALDGFLDTLEQLDSQSRAEAIAEILGTEYADDINLLINSLGDYRQALENVGDQQQTNGALQKEFEAQVETTAAQYQLLKNELRDTAIELGNAFLPAVRLAIAAGKSLAEAIGAVVETAPGLAAAAASVATFGAALGGLRIAGAAARLAVTGVIGSVTSAAGGFVRYTAALAGNTTAAAANTTAQRANAGATAAAGASAAGAATRLAGVAGVLARIPRLVGIGLVLTGAEVVISALLEIRSVQQQLKATEQAVQAELQKGIDAAGARAAQYAADAANVGNALTAIAAGAEQLTDSQRRYYADALAGAEQYLTAQIAIGVREQELYGQTEIDLAAVRTRLMEVREAQSDLQAGIDAASPLTADAVIGSDLLARIDEARESIGELSAKDLAELQTSAQRSLGEVSAQVKAAAAQFPALSGAAVEAALALDSRYSGLVDAQTQLTQAVEAFRAETLQRLGVDASEVLTGIDSKARELIDSFDALAADTGADARLIQAAFENLLADLDSPEELEALKSSLQGVTVQGFDAAKGVAEIDEKLKGLGDTADEELSKVAEAYKKLGITSSAVLQTQADEARAAADAIRLSGAPLADQERAWLAVLEAELKAADAAGNEYAEKTIAATALAKASTEEQRAKVQEVIDKYVELGGESADASDAAVQGHEAAATAAGKQAKAVGDIAANTREAVDAQIQLNNAAAYDPRAIPDRTTSTAASSLPAAATLLSGDDRDALQILAAQLQKEQIDEIYKRNKGVNSSSLSGASADASQRIVNELETLTRKLAGGGASAEAARKSIYRQLGIPYTSAESSSGTQGSSNTGASGSSATTPENPVSGVTPSQTIRVEFMVGGNGPFPADFRGVDALEFIQELQRAAGVALIN